MVCAVVWPGMARSVLCPILPWLYGCDESRSPKPEDTAADDEPSVCADNNITPAPAQHTMIDYRVWAGVLVRCIEDMEANDEYLVPSSNRIGPEHYLPFELEIFLHFFLYSGPSALIFGL